jgi:hypothetical protein
MRKLKLKLDELKVDSFTTTTSRGTPGTVHGRGGQTPEPVTIDDGMTNTTCIGPTYCCGATGPSIPVCIGPTYCCNPTANTGCCPAPTGTCPPTPYYDTCEVSCPEEACIP